MSAPQLPGAGMVAGENPARTLVCHETPAPGPFALGRMRHLDLLAAYFQVTGWGSHGSSTVDPMGAAAPGALIDAILART